MRTAQKHINLRRNKSPEKNVIEKGNFFSCKRKHKQFIKTT